MERFPVLDEATPNDLLLVFISVVDNNTVLLSLFSQGRTLEPAVCYVPADTEQTRRTRLITEASSLHFVVMDEGWMFLGWRGQQEIWAAFNAMCFQSSPQPLVMLSSQQLKELIEQGEIISSSPSNARHPELARPGDRYNVQSWILELAEKIGLT